MTVKVKSGFTLAEVLVTLGIIGVVAAMTIPTLMNQTSDAEYKTGLKKAVSVLGQAVTMNYALHGVDFSHVVAAASGDDDGETSLPSIINNRLSVVDTAGSGGAGGVTSTNCGTISNAYTLNDGMIIGINTANACTAASPCKICVDVNGLKGPNKLSEAVDKTKSSADVYVLNAYGQTVTPADDAGKYVLFGKVGASS